MNMVRFPPRSILVPTDFSERSLGAWRYAQELAARMGGASLGALHVARPSEGRTDPRHLSRSLRGWASGASAIHADRGDVLFGILRTIDEHGYDLAVMATEGAAGLKRLRHESMAELVVRSSPVPVLSLHGPAAAPRSILVPVKTAEYSLDGLRFARLASESLGATLSFLHVRERAGDADLAELKRSAPGVKIVSGDPVRAIVAEAAKHDLVFLVAHRGGIFHDAILGSTAEQVLRLSPTPVLTAPPFARIRAERPRRPSWSA